MREKRVGERSREEQKSYLASHRKVVEEFVNNHSRARGWGRTGGLGARELEF